MAEDKYQSMMNYLILSQDSLSKKLDSSETNEEKLNHYKTLKEKIDTSIEVLTYAGGKLALSDWNSKRAFQATSFDEETPFPLEKILLKMIEENYSDIEDRKEVYTDKELSIKAKISANQNKRNSLDNG